MNEKTYQRFSKLKSAQKHDELPQVFADVARQLTIANEYRESELTVGRAIAEQIGKIADQEQPDIKVEVSKYPDALVDAARNVLRNYVPGDQMLDSCMIRLESVLGPHGKGRF